MTGTSLYDAGSRLCSQSATVGHHAGLPWLHSEDQELPQLLLSRCPPEEATLYLSRCLCLPMEDDERTLECPWSLSVLCVDGP